MLIKQDYVTLRYPPAWMAVFVAILIACFPTRSNARDGAAFVGAMVGVAAAAMIANGIAQQHRPRTYRAVRHRRHVASTPRRQTTLSSGDPFAGVTAAKARPAGND